MLTECGRQSIRYCIIGRNLLSRSQLSICRSVSVAVHIDVQQAKKKMLGVTGYTVYVDVEVCIRSANKKYLLAVTGNTVYVRTVSLSISLEYAGNVL